MQPDSAIRDARPAFVRPIATAIALTVIGEAAIFLIWSFVLFPGRNLWIMAGWAAICGIAMGAVIGALVDLFVTGRLDGMSAFVWTAALCFAVLAACTFLCFRIDLTTGGRFGAGESPTLFILGGLIPAFLGSLAYAWLITRPRGQRLLARIGI